VSELLIVNRAISGNRMAIRKEDVVTFYEDEIEVDDETKKCVKIELQNHSFDWVKVNNKFDYILNNIKEEK